MRQKVEKKPSAHATIFCSTVERGGLVASQLHMLSTAVMIPNVVLKISIELFISGLDERPPDRLPDRLQSQTILTFGIPAVYTDVGGFTGNVLGGNTDLLGDFQKFLQEPCHLEPRRASQSPAAELSPASRLGSAGWCAPVAFESQSLTYSVNRHNNRTGNLLNTSMQTAPCSQLK